MGFIEENALLFLREAMPTLSVLAQRPNLAHLWLAVTGLLTAGFSSAVHVPDGGGGAGGRWGCGVYLRSMQPAWCGTSAMMWQAHALCHHGTAGSVVSLAPCVVAGPWQSSHTSYDKAEETSLRC